MEFTGAKPNRVLDTFIKYKRDLTNTRIKKKINLDFTLNCWYLKKQTNKPNPTL